MVPQHKTPDEPPRSFSPEVEAQLLEALRGLAASTQAGVSDDLRRALARAGAEARERQLQPEELLVAFKSLEEQVGPTIRTIQSDRAEVFRVRMIRALLEAYYG